ncbi:unnamed protein product [Leptidea sinapis]|uniref:Uncharacterized protein n=1 Tax=Leptidea sinapis TaxID=189913 RepID=A0A5E4QM38_9NEOP|nr:unnamed protein product [Leptidea sinapis]
MPHSESDDFESADEGQYNQGKKERKKRNSSSNYSDNLDADSNTSQTTKTVTDVKKSVGRYYRGLGQF